MNVSSKGFFSDKKILFKTISFILFELFLFLNQLSAQTQLKSLNDFNNKNLVDTVRLNAVNALVWKLSSQNPDTALLLCNQQLQIASTIKSNLGKIKWFGRIYHTMANAYSNKSNYSEALKYNFKSAKIRDSLGDYKRLANSYNNIANIYSYLNENNKALNYYFKTLDLFEKVNSKAKLPSTLINIGIIYLNTNNYNKAYNYFLQSLKLYTQTNDSAGISAASKYLATIYIEQKKYSLAELYYQKAYTHIRSKGLTPELASIFIDFSDLKSKVGDYKVALNYADTAFQIVSKNGDLYLLRNIHHIRAQAYAGLKKYEQAFTEALEFKDVNDTIFNTENKLDVLAQQNKFENELKEFKLQTKEKEIQLLAKNTDLKEVALKKQKYIQGLIMISVALLWLIIVLAILYYTINKRKKQQIIFSKKLIVAQEEERKRIAFELHDSIGQNLVFMKGMVENKEINKIDLSNNIKTTLEEVRSISKDLYPSQLEQLGFIQSIQALINKVTETTKLLATADIEPIEDKLNAEQKINIYRVIQECITNCIKHANATALRITILKSNKLIEATIQDNGKGFDTNNSKIVSSTGLISLRERTHLLNGKISISSTLNKGTKITLQIPITV
jgi:signal transduction histidine kinase